ncbi:transient receptor potential cation channel subfamily M member 5 isoform X1 [Sus scrofa]|uniref:transient receptor potential cation channel subfamily M member 5 isoform X1 n=1 Tax=Sus scrofa TaxID=9823 RepID=UPI000A2AF731|nr:transient receptor potential cation channel subfamily M member 5 isoform X1 [Sus scrofa]
MSGPRGERGQDPPCQNLRRSGNNSRDGLAAPREGEAPMQDAGGVCSGGPGGAGDRWGPGLLRGEIEFGGSGKKRGKFVKVPSSVAPSVLFDLLLAEWHLPAPNLVVSLVGEERPFAVKSWLRDVLRKGLVKAAQSTGAWILTSALRVGLARYVGQAVRDQSLASTSTKARVVAIGIAPLGRVLHRQLLDDAQEDSPVRYPMDDSGGQGPLCPLDNNHSHFILVEPGPPGKGDGPTELRLRLERHISEQRTGYGGTSSIEIPVLCLLVNGDPSTLERISRAVEHAAPWLILAGSGGVADVLAALMHQPQLLVPQVAEKQLREKFPSEHFSREDILHWTALLQNIASHPHLLTVHDFEQEGSEELDTVILKALVKACKSHSQEAQDYLDELKLAVAWDRVDIAKSEIFNGDVEWKSHDLEEVLMDALVNNKPEFVRLLVDNGADVADFLTYGRLQQLYRSVRPKSLLFDLLQRKLEEGRLTLGLGAQPAREPPAGPPAFSLHEVSRVLKDFLHDACRGLYQAERGPARRPPGQKGLLDLTQRSENPWRDLFLWAVLQNRHEMATYFWAMGQEGVAAALAACKILKEMAHLETEAAAGRTLCQAKYEQLALGEHRGGARALPETLPEGQTAPVMGTQLPASGTHPAGRGPRGGGSHGPAGGRPGGAGRIHVAAPGGWAPGRAQLASWGQRRRAGGGRAWASVAVAAPSADLFSECYGNSEERAFALLVRRNRSWSRTTCLHLATEADAKAFFAHDGVQAFLTRIWWGDMASGTPVLRLLAAFLCPALIYTNLITFREEAPLRTGLEDLQELDSLDTEKSLLCSPGSRAEARAVAPRTRGSRGPHAAFLLTRWRKFWGAPVTVFLGNVLMYFAFLFLFSYVLLVDFRPPPQGPSGPEVTLYFWVFTLVLEEIRQGFFTDEDTHLVKKVMLYVEDNWNKCDMGAIFLFIAGVTCRVLPSGFEAGRTILAVDFMVFALRLIHIFAIHKQLGPKIIIVERMVRPPGGGEAAAPARRVLSASPPPRDEGRLLLPLLPERVARGLRRDHPGAAAPPRRPPGVDLPPRALPALPADLRADPPGRDRRSPRELLRAPAAAGGLALLPEPLCQLAGHPPAGHLPAGHQRAAHEPAHRHVQLHVPGGAGQRGHVLEVPALPPHRGVSRAPGPGPALHPPQPPEPAAQAGLPEGGRAEAGAPGERPAGAPGPEGGHLGGGAEGERAGQAGEAAEGQRGGAASKDGPQGGLRSQVPGGAERAGEAGQAARVSGQLLHSAPVLRGRHAGPGQRLLELLELQQWEPTGFC